MKLFPGLSGRAHSVGKNKISKNYIQTVVAGIMLSGCGVSQTVNNENKPIATSSQVHASYMPTLKQELEAYDLGSPEIIEIIESAPSKTTIESPDFIIGELADTSNWGESLLGPEWDQMSNDIKKVVSEILAGESIRFITIPEYNDYFQNLEEKAKELADFGLIVPCGKGYIIRKKKEFELRIPFTCEYNKPESTYGYFETPMRGYYNVNMDGIDYEYPHKECKKAKHYKYQDPKVIGNMNTDIYSENQHSRSKMDEAFIDTCYTKRPSRVIINQGIH